MKIPLLNPKYVWSFCPLLLLKTLFIDGTSILPVHKGEKSKIKKGIYKKINDSVVNANNNTFLISRLK